MTKEQIIADLDYASAIARDGATTPLLGGPIGLMWGILISAALMGMWAILTRIINVPYNAIWVIWVAFAVIGGFGSAILGKRIDNKAGANSVANRVESYVWIMFSGFAGTLFIGAVLNMVLQKASPEIFYFIMVAAFAAQGLAYGVVAKLTNLKWIHMASLASFVSSAVCFSMLGDVNMYVVASIAAIITIVIPSLISMQKANKNA